MSSGISAQTYSAVRGRDYPLYERTSLLLSPSKFMWDRLHGFERQEKFLSADGTMARCATFPPKPKPRGISVMVSKYLFFRRDRT